MDIIDFLGMNIIILIAILLAIVLYLISLINKRRKSKFLHSGDPD